MGPTLIIYQWFIREFKSDFNVLLLKPEARSLACKRACVRQSQAFDKFVRRVPINLCLSKTFFYKETNLNIFCCV